MRSCLVAALVAVPLLSAAQPAARARAEDGRAPRWLIRETPAGIEVCFVPLARGYSRVCRFIAKRDEVPWTALTSGSIAAAVLVLFREPLALTSSKR